MQQLYGAWFQPQGETVVSSTAESQTICGTVDRDSRLLSADPRLLDLQTSAGGELGGPLAVPQLAALARLASTLGVVVSRNIVIAEGERDLDVWVRAEPECDTIRLAIAGWGDHMAEEQSPEYLAQRAQDIAMQSPDGAWTTDEALRLTIVDDNLLQAMPEKWRGERLTRIFSLFPSDDGDYRLLDAVLDGQSFAQQAAALTHDPSVEGHLHGAPIRRGDGAIIGYTGGVIWTQAPPVGQIVAEAVGGDDPQFVERLDDALRVPLNRIITNADMIASADQAPIAKDYASYASDVGVAGRHLLGMVDDLKDLQAVERPGFEIQTERLDLADVARRAASLLGVRAADRNIMIDAPSSDENLWAKADFRRTLQIMVNLVSNAVRYSPSHSMVWIRAEREADVAALIIADQGKGIAQPDQDRIFNKFERIDPSEPGGSGLGLYISRRLARAMGGDITVDSAPGRGARFVLTLPASD